VKHKAPSPPKKRQTRRRGRGEGGITELADGSFEVSVSLGVHPGTGKRVRVKRQRRTKTEAMAELQKLRTAPTSTTTGDKMTVAQWLQRWLTDVAAPAVRPKTLASYRAVVEKHLTPGLGALTLSALTPVHVQAFFAKAAAIKAPSRQMQIALVVLRQALDNARRMGVVAANAAVDIDAPKHKKIKSGSLTQEEADRFLDAVDVVAPDEWPLILLALDTGARQGELFGAQWEDVDLDAQPATWAIEHNLLALTRAEVTAAVAAGHGVAVDGVADMLLTDTPKTEDGRRVVHLSEPCRVAMLEHRAKHGGKRAKGFVFTVEGGSPHRNGNFAKRVLAPALAHAQLERITFHELRHTTATLLLEAGVPVHVVSHRLGHKDVATTLRIYAHVLRRMALKGAEAAGSLFGARAAGRAKGRANEANGGEQPRTLETQINVDKQEGDEL
jgi:integrase